MKKSTLMVLACLLFLGVVNVKAASANDYEIKATVSNEGTAAASLKMNLYNFGELIKSSDTESYYVKFLKDEENFSIPTFESSYFISTDTDYKSLDKYHSVTNSGLIEITDDFYLLKDYNSALIIKCAGQGNNCHYVDKVNVKKPELPALSERYHIFVFNTSNGDSLDNTLSVFPLFPHVDSTGKRNNIIKVKIGLIKDNDIIQKFANNDSDALTSLLAYAKSSNDAQSWSIADDYSVDLNGFEVSNGSYYYIYTTMDDSIYRNLEDVAIVMGESKILSNDIDFNNQDIEDTNVEEKNPENPKTGLNNYYLIGGLVLITSGIGYILVRNKKKFVK